MAAPAVLHVLLRQLQRWLLLPSSASCACCGGRGQASSIPASPASCRRACKQSGEVQALWMPKTFLDYVAATDCSVAVVQHSWTSGSSLQLIMPPLVSGCTTACRRSISKLAGRLRGGRLRARMRFAVCEAEEVHRRGRHPLPFPMHGLHAPDRCPPGHAVQFDVAFAFSRGFNNTGLLEKLNAALLALKEERESAVQQGQRGCVAWPACNWLGSTQYVQRA